MTVPQWGEWTDKTRPTYLHFLATLYCTVWCTSTVQYSTVSSPSLALSYAGICAVVSSAWLLPPTTPWSHVQLAPHNTLCSNFNQRFPSENWPQYTIIINIVPLLLLLFDMIDQIDSVSDIVVIEK